MCLCGLCDNMNKSGVSFNTKGQGINILANLLSHKVHDFNILTLCYWN